MTAQLTLPAVQVLTDPPAGPPSLERPLTLQLGPLSFPDGQPLRQDDTRKIGAFVYRAQGSAEQIWNEGERNWTKVPPDLATLATLTPLPLQFKAGDPAPWQGLLVAAGQKDQGGAARFATAQNGAPAYRLRAFVNARRDGIDYTGLGPPSADLHFVSLAESQRFAVRLDTGDAQNCQQVRLMLKNGALSEAGYVEIRTTGGQEVEIANCTPGGAVKARIVLLDNGDIRLEPASGRNIVLGGTLEAERITYQPHNGAGRLTL
ncbi:hypothetical protein IV454_24060 [Massilia antarctica]|uniref:Uncharacterized protein n=1 Tax=Massilia antarctica TaxID=2765360 RepID=A0AA48WAV2_9BURK|nr:hypothetical protein [Massilia antarctica]QPI48576.1 hypothetical protein IV454_24060 [Massilia antarctica]